MYADPNTDENFQGRWHDIGIVSDLGTTEETIEYVDRVYADSSISKDTEEDEFNYNGTRYSISEEGHSRREMEFGIHPGQDNADLETLGIVGENGEELFNVRHEAVLIIVWPNPQEEDESTAIRRLGENVRVQTEDEDLGDGPYEMAFSLFLEGEYYYDPSDVLNDDTV